MLYSGDVKLEARSVLKARFTKLLLMSLAFYAISLLISVLYMRLTGLSDWINEIMRRMESWTNALVSQLGLERFTELMLQIQYGSEDAFDEAMGALGTPVQLPNLMQFNRGVFATVLAHLILLMNVPLEAGYSYHTLQESRGVQTKFDSLLFGFKVVWKSIAITLLTALLVTLGTILLVVPGIIMTFRYTMAIYVLLDDPSKGIVECMRESGRLMRGAKWRFFILELSFIGWSILGNIIESFVGLDILSLWLTPYIYLSRGVFYNRLLQRQRDQMEFTV